MIKVCLFLAKLESTQYQAALAVSGAWKDTNMDRLLEERGWETLSNGRWYRRLCPPYKIINNHTSNYLCGCVPIENKSNYQLRQANVFRQDITS